MGRSGGPAPAGGQGRELSRRRPNVTQNDGPQFDAPGVPQNGWRAGTPNVTPNNQRIIAHAGVSLLEILVVIAITGILIAIGVPTLAMARTSAHRAHCASNQRQVFLAAGMYAVDHRSYLGQADALDYQTPSSTNNGKPLPGQFLQAGFNNPLTRQGDHYLALGYMRRHIAEDLVRPKSL